MPKLQAHTAMDSLQQHPGAALAAAPALRLQNAQENPPEAKQINKYIYIYNITIELETKAQNQTHQKIVISLTASLCWSHVSMCPVVECIPCLS